MNDKELKEQLLAAGANKADLEKVDFDKIEKIISNASSIESLCKSLRETYPDFNEADFKKVITEKQEESEDTQDLSESDLEAVAGGSIGSWINKNKTWLVPLAAVTIMAGYVLYDRYQHNKKIAAAEKEFPGEKGNIVAAHKDKMGYIVQFKN